MLKVFDKLYITFPVTILLNVIPVSPIAQTDAVWFDASLAFEIVKSRIVLFDIVFVPLEDIIPLMRPLLEVDELAAPLVILAIVLLLMIIVPEPAEIIPITAWAFDVPPEVALILLDVVVLPIILLLMVVVPAPVLFIPVKLTAKVLEAAAAVIEPMELN